MSDVTKYYIDANGKYLGAMSESIKPPKGWIEVPTAPDDGSQTWKDGKWSAFTQRRMVSKSVVQDRLIAKDKMKMAYQMLTSSPNQFAKWFAPNHPAIYCDDPDAVAFVTALGLDPKEILAPE